MPDVPDTKMLSNDRTTYMENIMSPTSGSLRFNLSVQFWQLVSLRSFKWDQVDLHGLCIILLDSGQRTIDFCLKTPQLLLHF